MFSTDEERAKLVETPVAMGIPIEEYREYMAREALDGKNYCRSTWSGYICTCMKGHKGPHIAHGGNRVCATWEKREKTCRNRKKRAMNNSHPNTPNPNVTS